MTNALYFCLLFRFKHMVNLTMSKIITQETFNDIVKENQDEFGMAEDEAIEDAIKQFEAQGVNLSSIVTNAGKAAKIVDLTKNLEVLVAEHDNEEELKACLTNLSTLIKGEMSCKLLAAKTGLYTSLMSCLKSGGNSLRLPTLHAFVALMDGYPDLLDDDGAKMILTYIDRARPIEEIKVALRWLAVCVEKHESTRARLIRSGIASKLQDLASNGNPDRDVVAGICTAVQVLVKDDDVRVVHGDAHEHARSLAPKLLPLLIILMEGMAMDASVTADLLQATTSLLVRNEFCIQFHEEGGLKPVLNAMLEHSENDNVVRHCLLLLKSLAGSDEVKEPIVSSGAAPLIVSALEKHFKCGQLAVAACMCIAALCLRSKANSEAFGSAGISETLLRCMTHWKNNRSIVKNGCLAIRNQISRFPELKTEYLDLQIEPFLREVRSLHGDLDFESKSVLLDLGCAVELKEEWKGRGVQLRN